MNLLKRETPLSSPVKVIQFGEGNFLRAFIDWMIQEMNDKCDFNGAVQLVQPIEKGMADMINAQDGLYSLILRGVENGKVISEKRVIECVKGCLNPASEWNEVIKSFCSDDLRFMFSNTTEAGIEYKPEPYTPGVMQTTFPAKVTALFYERFKAGKKGLLVIPCELIDKNGATLKKYILQYADDWKLGDDFKNYIENGNTFFNTLVDRIVAGYPRNEAAQLCEEFGYQDNLIDCGEVFHLFVIEGPKTILNELPFDKANLNVIVTDNQKPYRERKVRFLNGAHTGSVLGAYLGGCKTVDQMVEHPVFGKFVEKLLFDEIFKTVQLPDDEKKAFASSILERFKNPFANHQLLSISLNSISKFKVRNLPSLLDYYKLEGKLPQGLVFSLAALITFYTTDGDYTLNDDADAIAFMKALPGCPVAKAEAVLANTAFWGEDLSKIANFTDLLAADLKNIAEKGIEQATKDVL